MLTFTRPATVTLPLADGEWIVVKKALSNGEHRASLARMYTWANGARHVDPLQSGIAVVVAYLLDWSAKDPTGEPIPIRGLSVEDLVSVLDNLSPASFTEIKDAVMQHQETCVLEEMAKKKTPDGAPTPAMTSRSPSVVTGPSTTSETSSPPTAS